MSVRADGPLVFASNGPLILIMIRFSIAVLGVSGCGWELGEVGGGGGGEVEYIDGDKYTVK